MSPVKLSILIATQGRRKASFMRLLAQLLPQAEQFPGEIEVVAYWNNGELSIGDLRQRLLEEAKGEYVCYVDDDDMVPDWYCAEIMKNLGEDYVGFEVELFEREKKMPRVFHSIRYGVWHQDENGYYRGVTHLNPIRRSIAIQGSFGTQGLGEDESWARVVTPLVRTEKYIDKIMYYYHHDGDKTFFGGSEENDTFYQRAPIDSFCFRYHPSSNITWRQPMKAIDHCRLCRSPNLTQFLDLGEQYLSDFRADADRPPKYPLVAVFCEDCKLVQLKHTTPQYEMYHDRYGFKSGVSNSIKDDLKSVVEHGLRYKKQPKEWLDIASNDGTLLSYVPKKTFRVGVDPVTFLCREAEQHADLIVNEYFGETELPMQFDVITSISCFYDMPEPHKFVKDVEAVLDEKGVWIIQQNYLLTTMELSAVDNFCHEHLEYYTLLSLEPLLSAHNLEVNEVSLSDVNGGSIRTVVSHKGAFKVDESVALQRQREAEAHLDAAAAYHKFAEDVWTELKKLHEWVITAKNMGKTVCIIAASTRGATIWQSAHLTNKEISYAVERNPAKVGKMFSAIEVPIISEEEFREKHPDIAIVGPWFFAPEIVDREKAYVATGGTLLIPLPKVRKVHSGKA